MPAHPRVDLLIHRACLVSPGSERPSAALRIRDGRIAAIFETSPDPASLPPEIDTFDAAGHYLVPGFIDLHTHGAGGGSMMDGPDGLRRMARHKLTEGVTTFLPTTWTASEPNLASALDAVTALLPEPGALPRRPAVHVEGPFLNPARAGAQDPARMRPPDLAELDRLASRAPIAIVSLAPELPGGLEFVAGLRERGIIPSLAHSDATWSQFQDAVHQGARHLTHFGNQMRPLHHREIGLVGAGLLDDSILLELIADGIHLAPEMIRLVFKIAGPDRIMLVTDSISASGMPDGDYLEAGQQVHVRDGVCRLPNGVLAGSTLTFDAALRTVLAATSLQLRDVIATTAANQARSLGWSDRGHLTPGFLADLVLLDRDTLRVRQVWIDGISCFRAEP